MFTGLVQEIGTLERVVQASMTDLWVRSTFDALQLGESIACDGCCLTVVEATGGTFKVQASPETLRRTTVGEWRAGTRLNLERALKVGDRMGGHWVQGHVDSIARVLVVREEGGSRVMGFELPPPLAPFFIEKGSVTIDGISLTVNALDAQSFSVALIPETVSRTTLGAKGPGARVNLEADLVGKYVARQQGLKGTALSQERLEAAGW
ncbi:MAG: riboflavin synthase [Myxococcaceae bacterium]|nr:riboflavin synthase [Myxococcaceae bacterium]